MGSTEEAHSRLVTRIVLSRDCVFTSSRDKTVKIWTLGINSDPGTLSVTLIKTLDVHSHSVWSVDWSRSLDYIS